MKILPSSLQNSDATPRPSPNRHAIADDLPLDQAVVLQLHTATLVGPVAEACKMKTWSLSRAVQLCLQGNINIWTWQCSTRSGKSLAGACLHIISWCTARHQSTCAKEQRLHILLWQILANSAPSWLCRLDAKMSEGRSNMAHNHSDVQHLSLRSKVQGNSSASRHGRDSQLKRGGTYSERCLGSAE